MASATDIHPKVAAATIGAAISTIGLYAFTQVTHNSVPDGVRDAIVVVLTFALGWLAPERVSEGTGDMNPVIIPAPIEQAPIEDGETPK